MKRLGPTLAAAALTGAIAFAGVPASASEGAVPQPTSTLGDRGTNDNNENGDKGHEEDEEGDRGHNEGGTPYDGGSKSRAECSDDKGAKLSIKWGDERPDSFEYDGKTWFKHKDGEHYVTDSANREGELSEQDKFESNQAGAKKFGYSCDYEASNEHGDHHSSGHNDHSSNSSKSREECEEHNDHKDCETTTLGDRGMNVETGDNTVARVLFALVALSVLGAAAFGARRFFSA